MDWTLIATQDAFEALLLEHRGAPAVAVDTEFMRRNTFYPQVALLQLCFADHAWLVDPLALEDTAPLLDLFEDPSITKVLHSASEDLEVFDHWLGALPRPLFDTQRAAGLLDKGFGLGYRGLVEQAFAVTLDKGETRSDWLRRPLSEAQCRYAALDVAYLLPLYERLRGDAEAAGKLSWILEEGEVACAGAGSRNPAYHLRVKSAWKLQPRQLAALERLCAWREEEAASRDKPRSWILDDRLCLAIAGAMPANPDALAAVGEIPPAILRRCGAALLDAIAEARSLPESALPVPLPAPLDGEERKRLKALKARVRTIAEAATVAPEMLLAGRDLELLLREARGLPISEPASWQGWRRTRVIEPLRSALAEGAL
ncbi:ribonuclease D [Pseudohaliea rubra]|uniref:Ribonuclease D n=1 Tax=Pseudohaliea rubra DSM 19751 TaxID=1265313 RepID=A0A095VQW2_9GAMM|nr:ribonuclease D [Pseudohaliea rubra]KGE03760.1 Ribonuclease D [Pseudohaliea rubra DSM 19751]